MLTMTHALTRSMRLPADPDSCRAVLQEFMRHVERLSDVASVEAYPGGVYRVILNKMGGTIGAWSYGVHIAYDLQLELLPDRMTAVSLPRDPHDSWIGDGILLSDYRSETRWAPAEAGVELHHAMDLKVDLPLPGFLAFAPRPLMQALADGLMRQKATGMIDEMLELLSKELA